MQSYISVHASMGPKTLCGLGGCWARRAVPNALPRHRLARTMHVLASASDDNASAPGEEPPKAAVLSRRAPGIGYTFILAGFLKIITMGGLATSAPKEVSRTAFGQVSQYLLWPVGIAMCFIAKAIVDNGFHESKRFVGWMLATLVLLYFGLVKLLYVYEPSSAFLREQQGRPAASRRLGGSRYDMLANRDGIDMRGSTATDPKWAAGRPAATGAFDFTEDEAMAPSTSARLDAARAGMLDRDMDRHIMAGLLDGDIDTFEGAENSAQPARPRYRREAGGKRAQHGPAGTGIAGVNVRKGFGPPSA